MSGHSLVKAERRAGRQANQPPSCQNVEGVKVFLLAHAYWPVLERLMPDSRDVFNVRRLTQKLDRAFHYDWIEIQSEEGIGIGAQRAFSRKTVLRAHTTLPQMVNYKGEARSGGPEHDRHAGQTLAWGTRYRLWRERRSFGRAERIVTHSAAHAAELKRLYPGMVEPAVVWHGIGCGATAGIIEQKVAKNAKQDDSISATGGSEMAPLCASRSSVQNPGAFRTDVPTFLIVGSADRRKGFDRIRPVLEVYATAYGPCRVVIAAFTDEVTKAAFKLNPTSTGPVEVVWKGPLSSGQLAAEYDHATVYLHLARYESFGIPLVEAAGHGLPVVSTSVGIAPDLLAGELAEFVVSGDDPVAVAAALRRAVTNRASISEHLAVRYRADFTRDRMADGFLRLLNVKT
jgi:glycosyltransferase involved in cell wall biosynthesis